MCSQGRFLKDDALLTHRFYCSLGLMFEDRDANIRMKSSKYDCLAIKLILIYSKKAPQTNIEHRWNGSFFADTVCSPDALLALHGCCTQCSEYTLN